MTGEAIQADARDKMRKGVEYFGENLKGLRAGRVTPALVDNVRVEAYGSPTPLNQLATVSVPEPRQLLVKPFDPSMCTAIEKGILKSDLGITPETDGKVVRLNVPMMSGEQREKMAARVRELAEQARVTVRNIRRDQNKEVESAKKAGDLSEDQEHDLKEEMNKLTKEMETEIEKLQDARIKEIQDS
ncbi:MAG: ribosome-recycling factor [Planctomycetota bacterium]|nr:MAG: ribosome-recycling factor [Planctomycetota bacterium]